MLLTPNPDVLAAVYYLGKNEEKGGCEVEEDERGKKESQGTDKHSTQNDSTAFSSAPTLPHLHLFLISFVASA